MALKAHTALDADLETQNALKDHVNPTRFYLFLISEGEADVLNQLSPPQPHQNLIFFFKPRLLSVNKLQNGLLSVRLSSF